MAVDLALVFGAFLGWLYSLLARTGTNAGIVIDIFVDILGAAEMALAFGNNSTFDSLVADLMLR